MDILLKNTQALVWKENQGIHSQFLNIGIHNSKIAYLGPETPQAQETIDLQGLTTLPGIIDSQVHFREPGMTHKEDIEAGSRGAALGGVTCFFEMPNTKPPTVDAPLLEQKMQIAQSNSWVNYAFFVGGGSDNYAKLKELESHPGCPGVKVFMGSSTGNLLVEDDQTLELILKNTKKPVIIHSEDEPRLRERKHIAQSNPSPQFHPVWRDELTALRSTQRAVNLAQKLERKVHILHLTTAEEMDYLKDKKRWVSLEVLPQHLTLSAPECYERLGTLAQQNPPIREKRHQDALWNAVRSGLIDVMGSDHAPHTLEEKGRTYPESPSGMPGVQTLVPIMLNHIHNQKLSLERFVNLMCEGPRKVFGIKNKGRLQVGADADLTIVDLKKEMRIENSWIQSKSQWTPFDGMKVTGWPIHTICNGVFVVRDGSLIQKSATRVVFE